MSIPMLVNGGIDCGPSNPLQTLTKRFDSDRRSFRPRVLERPPDQSGASYQPPTDVSFQAEAHRFFSQTPQAPAIIPSPSTLWPAVPDPNFASVNSPLKGWASEFLVDHPGPQPLAHPSFGHIESAHRAAPQSEHVGSTTGSQFNIPTVQRPPLSIPGPSTMRFHSVTRFPVSRDTWQQQHRAPTHADDESIAAAIAALQLERTPVSNGTEGNELARTAALLVESVQFEQSPKFRNSTFLSLMRQLRDGEMVVDGNTIAQASGDLAHSQGLADAKGKGKAKEDVSTLQPLARKTVHFDSNPSLFEYASYRKLEVPEGDIDEYLRTENEEYADIWSEHDDMRYASRIPGMFSRTQRMPTAEEAEWGALQADWDRFEATSSGIKPVEQYNFAQSSSLAGDSTRHHSYHDYSAQQSQSILELEEEVQRDITNARKWFELGVKHQENERENKAIQALKRAVELDPSFLDAWLALAMSFSNEGQRVEAYGAIEKWVESNQRYADVVKGLKPGSPGGKRDALVDSLVAMIRSVDGGQVDADTQVALAVVLHTSEDYTKAHDCFRAALETRPHDWLLYNRVGATLANSGNATEALQYYYKALELNPAYIRARFNLSISCANLKRYDEAARHVLDALTLQTGQTTEMPSNADINQDIASMALWNALKSSLIHLHRMDLATLCDDRDLDRVRDAMLL